MLKRHSGRHHEMKWRLRWYELLCYYSTSCVTISAALWIDRASIDTYIYYIYVRWRVSLEHQIIPTRQLITCRGHNLLHTLRSSPFLLKHILHNIYETQINNAWQRPVVIYFLPSKWRYLHLLRTNMHTIPGIHFLCGQERHKTSSSRQCAL